MEDEREVVFEHHRKDHASDDIGEATSHISYPQEVARKALHLLTLCIPVALLILGKPVTLPIIAAITVIALAADIARARSEVFNRFILKIFGILMRLSERNPRDRGVVVNGATWVLVGATICILLFDERIAAAALIMSLLGDAAAALVGRPWGRVSLPWGSKTLEGSLSFFAVAAIFAIWLPGPSYVVGLLGAIAGTIAEAVPLPLNDNIYVPLSAGLAMAAVTALLV